MMRLARRATLLVAFCALTSAATAHVFQLETAQMLNGWSRSEASSAREDFRAAGISCS
jgi:hypothetical protein